jgi:hypothetical protein
MQMSLSLKPTYNHYAPHDAIVDTSTLIVFLALTFLDMYPEEQYRSKVFKVIGKPHFADQLYQQTMYKDILTNIRTLYTTSHVIGELNRHIMPFGKVSEQQRELFLHHTFTILHNKMFDECLIKVFDVSVYDRYKESILRIGIVDTGLLLLAQQKRLPLLTEDGWTLTKEARQLGTVRCVHLPSYIAEL